MISTLLLAGYVFCRAWVSPVPYLARTDAFMIAGALLVYLLTSLYIHEARARLWIVAALTPCVVRQSQPGTRGLLAPRFPK